MKSAVHNSQTCIFNDANHRYTIEETGQVLTSGTTLIKRFFPKFDGSKIAAEIAEKRGTTPAELLREWQEKGDKASYEGSMVHSYAEYVFSDEELPPYGVDESSRYGRLTIQLLMALDKLYEKNFTVIEAEKIIFSPSLGVAGMIDLLLWGPARELVILDWKTNEELTLDNPFQSGLGPLTHLEDANLIHHSLQLSLYQYILMIENYYPEATGYKQLVVHLQEDCSRPYDCKYLEDEIEGMLI